MRGSAESSRSPLRHTGLPVRWRWPTLAAVLAVLGWAYIWPVFAFGTSYCPPDPPSPGSLGLLRGAVLLAFGCVAVPFVVAGLVDLWRGARREGRHKVWVAGGLLACGAVVAVGIRPDTWCF